MIYPKIVEAFKDLAASSGSKNEATIRCCMKLRIK